MKYAEKEDRFCENSPGQLLYRSTLNSYSPNLQKESIYWGNLLLKCILRISPCLFFGAEFWILDRTRTSFDTSEALRTARNLGWYRWNLRLTLIYFYHKMGDEVVLLNLIYFYKGHYSIEIWHRMYLISKYPICWSFLQKWHDWFGIKCWRIWLFQAWVGKNLCPALRNISQKSYKKRIQNNKISCLQFNGSGFAKKRNSKHFC